MNVNEPIYFWGKAAPHRPALAFPGGSVSYGELCKASDLAATSILQSGFRPRELVNIVVVNPAFQIILMLALGRLNIPFCFLQSAALGQTIGLKIYGSISEDPNVRRDPSRSLHVDHNWFVSKLGSEMRPPRALAETNSEDILRVVVTSGTTGKPKAMALTHGDFEARIAAATLHPDSGRTFATVSPSSSWGYLLVMKILRSGGTFCFAPFPDDGLSLCEYFRVDAICASVGQAATLVAEQKKLPRELSGVERVFIGGSLASPLLVKDIQSHICRNVGIGYGSTETGQSASAPFAVLGDTPGAVGFVHPGMSIEIVDEHDKPLPIGKSGSIRVGGPGLAKGYSGAGNPDESQFRNGFFYPGDIGQFNRDGVLIVEGRLSEVVLNKGGFKINTSMVEDSIRQEGNVSDVAVLAGTSLEGTPEVWAAVVVKGSVDSSALQAFYEKKLGASAPDRFFKVDSILRNDMGKIEYKAVRAKLPV